MSISTFDAIIAGAGSAAGVLPDRPSDDGRHCVLLLDAGPVDLPGDSRPRRVREDGVRYCCCRPGNIDAPFIAAAENAADMIMESPGHAA